MVTIKPTIKTALASITFTRQSNPSCKISEKLHLVKITCFTVYRYTWATLIVHMCSLLLIVTYMAIFNNITCDVYLVYYQYHVALSEAVLYLTICTVYYHPMALMSS